MNQGFLDKLHELWFRVGSATVMGLLALVCVSITSMEILEIFMGNQAYSVIGMSNVDGMTFRCLWYITSAFTVIAVLSLIPRGKIFFTHLGNRTMQVFILHSIICRIFFVTEAMDQLYESTNLFVIFGMAVAMVFLLSNHRLSKLVAWPQDLLYTIREKILA